ncbi:MAG: hypothetical protein AB7P52_17795 [Alphaproteobacteria bacterium]
MTTPAAPKRARPKEGGSYVREKDGSLRQVPPAGKMDHRVTPGDDGKGKEHSPSREQKG